MFYYETHCHTAPVSKCGKASAEDTVRFYKRMGYDGVFITNHFLDGNINPEARSLSWCGQIDYYFSDYEKSAEIGASLGIRVFPGVELSYKGTDFLIYGPEKEWYKAHPEIMDMKKTDEFLKYLRLAVEYNPQEAKTVLGSLFPEGTPVNKYVEYMEGVKES